MMIGCFKYSGRSHTVQASVIGLDVRFLHFTVLNDQCISLGAVPTEDRGAIEGKVKSFGELHTRISEKANLIIT